jgi:hypothetical protein
MSQAGSSIPPISSAISTILLCPSSGAGDDAPDWSPRDPINEQCVRRDLVTVVGKDRICLEALAAPVGGQCRWCPANGRLFARPLRPAHLCRAPLAARLDALTRPAWSAISSTPNVPACPVVQCLSGIMPPRKFQTTAGYKFARTLACRWHGRQAGAQHPHSSGRMGACPAAGAARAKAGADLLL